MSSAASSVPTGHLRGTTVVLRPAATADAAELVRIRATPEVWSRWGGADLEAEVAESLADDEVVVLVIVDRSGSLVGMIQFYEETDPQYRHASIDLFVDPARHNEGIGTDAIQTLVRYLFKGRGHHRLTIDPAADNAPAIRVYERAGFQPVGTMRQYEQAPDGSWHDGLLMELLLADWEGS